MKEDAESSHHSSWTKSVKWILSSSLIIIRISDRLHPPEFVSMNGVITRAHLIDAHQFALITLVRERHGVAVWNFNCEDSRNSMCRWRTPPSVLYRHRQPVCRPYSTSILFHATTRLYVKLANAQRLLRDVTSRPEPTAVATLLKHHWSLP